MGGHSHSRTVHGLNWVHVLRNFFIHERTNKTTKRTKEQKRKNEDPIPFLPRARTYSYILYECSPLKIEHELLCGAALCQERP